MRKEVCNCCGRTYRDSDTDICATCYEPMCPDCFRDHNGACCVDPPRSLSSTERAVVRVIQAQHASRQLKLCKAVKPAGGKL